MERIPKEQTPKTAPPTQEAPRRKITLERIYRATVGELWDLWTTKKGLESWWGPEGFSTTVRRLELRPGGRFDYEMTATGPEQIEAMKKANLPLTSRAHGTYGEVTPRRRLAYRTVADFIPGVEPYEIGSVIDFHIVPQGVRLTVTEDVMHNEEWTKMSEMGMGSSLDRLARVVEAGRGKG
ncbi:MAG: SRPBCC domain-containing protein, partial [Methanomicrobiales archaeon]|nr:SRPBCC domain-containing protein [Methanomicrobiales archaeon]